MIIRPYTPSNANAIIAAVVARINSLPGLDELMAALEIAHWVEARPDQCIVVDTAPAGHTLRLLAMPALLRKWIEVLNTLLAKHRYLKKLYGQSVVPTKWISSSPPWQLRSSAWKPCSATPRAAGLCR